MEIKGKKINLRLAQLDDAEFVLSLRLDPEKNRHLSRVDNDIKKQKDWLLSYKKREESKQEYYFIIEDKKSSPYGCVRLYDFKGDSF